MPTNRVNSISLYQIRTLIIACGVALFIGCETAPVQTSERNLEPSKNQIERAIQQPQNQISNEQEVNTKGSNEVFAGLNNTLTNNYCGLWQLYKRKPYNENERLITENNYLDLRKDYTFEANGWNIEGSGQWLPTYNQFNTGEPLLFILFTNTKHVSPQLTTVQAELYLENDTQMLKITELEKGSIDYYVRK